MLHHNVTQEARTSSQSLRLLKPPQMKALNPQLMQELWELHSRSPSWMEMCQLDTSTSPSHSWLLSLQIQTSSRNGISYILYKLRGCLGLKTEATAICCHFHHWQRHHSLAITLSKPKPKKDFLCWGLCICSLSQV